MPGNVLFITVDQWRGDCLSAAGHPVVETPALDRLAASGVRFANHWANAAPCGPSRACLYTGTYLHHHRSVHNGTPLDSRFTNVALLARQAGYDPVLFGYADTSVDPRTVASDDPRLFTYEGVLPGFDPVVVNPWDEGSPAWGRWLAKRGVEVPTNVHDLYQPVADFPGAQAHGASWAPTSFSADNSETAFLVERLIDWLDHHGDRPFFILPRSSGPTPRIETLRATTTSTTLMPLAPLSPPPLGKPKGSCISSTNWRWPPGKPPLPIPSSTAANSGPPTTEPSER